MYRIDRARKFAAGSGNFSDWRVEARETSAGRQEEVAELVRTLEHGGQRALLLATAMLHGAHAHRVHEASSRLLALAKQPEDETPLLEQPTLDIRLREIGAGLDDRERVRFRKLDYDSAVRTFFWTHLPDLRLPLREWLEQTAGTPELEDQERDELAERIVQQCAGARHWDMLADLVERWTEPGGPVGYAKAANAVLVNGLRRWETARFLRRRIYEWSQRRGLPPQLGALLVMACRDEIAITHPDEAIVRLHHLARRESGASRARDALLWLVEQDLRARRQMLRRLTDPNMNRWDFDRELFLVVADPRKLTVPGSSHPPVLVSAAVREQLVIGWREAFESSSPNMWGTSAQDWIGHAASDERFGGTLIDVLVTAGADQMAVLARLYTMARRRELDAAVADSLLHKINKVQGFLVDDM